MKDLARYLAARGRNGDTELLHVTKGELAALQGVGSLFGKQITVNPDTGLPEAFNFKSLIPAIVGIGGTVLSGGTLSPLTAGLISGAATTAATGDIKQGLMSGISGGMMSGLGQGLAEVGGAAGAAQGAGSAINPAASFSDAGFAANQAAQNIAPRFSDAAFDAGMANAASGAATTPYMGSMAHAAMPEAAAAAAPQGASGMMNPDAWGEAFGGKNLMSRTIPGMMGLSGVAEQAMAPDMSKGGGWEPDEFAQKEKKAEQDFRMPDDPYYAMKGGEHQYFSPTRYNFASGGVVDLPQGMAQDSGIMKAIKSIRSRYRSRQAALEDMKVPNSFMQRLGIRDPNDPVLDYAFGYTKKQGQKKSKAGNFMMPMMAEGGPVQGAGDGMSDDVPASIEGAQPARLARDEFVIPADVVSGLGNGSSEAGHQQLYGMIQRVRQARTGTPQQAPAINPKKVMPT